MSSNRHHSEQPFNEADHDSAFFLSDAEERRATMDPLDLLILMEEADGEDTMEILLASFTKH